MGGFAPGNGGGGAGAIPIIGPILDGIIGLFGGQTDYTWLGISGVSQTGFSNLNGVEDFLKQTVDGVKNIVKNIWNDVIIALIKKILDAYKKLRELLTKILTPILNLLHKLRDLYKKYVIGPMLRWVNLVQQVRKFLVIFRLLGFKWAQKLDQRLANWEAKVVQNTLVLQSWINFAIDAISLILDPSLIMKKNFLLASLLSFLGAVKRVVFFGANRTPSAAETTEAQQDSGVLSKGSHLLVSGFGSNAQYAPTVQRILPCIDEAIKYYSGPPENA